MRMYPQTFVHLLTLMYVCGMSAERVCAKPHCHHLHALLDCLPLYVFIIVFSWTPKYMYEYVHVGIAVWALPRRSAPLDPHGHRSGREYL